MFTFDTTLGYTTKNREWEVLTDKELALHDVLMAFNTRKGECDWDPNFGSTIIDRMFTPKTETTKMAIVDEIKTIFDNEPRLSLYNIEAQDVDKGWDFYCEVGYLNGTPEVWVFNVEKDNGVKLLSNGSYPMESE